MLTLTKPTEHGQTHGLHLSRRSARPYDTQDLGRCFIFFPLWILDYTLLYTVVHAVHFYMMNSTLPYQKILYNYFPVFHHEYVYAMNVYRAGYAEGSRELTLMDLDRWQQLVELDFAVDSSAFHHPCRSLGILYEHTYQNVSSFNHSRPRSDR